jgi:hypothetical protein
VFERVFEVEGMVLQPGKSAITALSGIGCCGSRFVPAGGERFRKRPLRFLAEIDVLVTP